MLFFAFMIAAGSVLGANLPESETQENGSMTSIVTVSSVHASTLPPAEGCPSEQPIPRLLIPCLIFKFLITCAHLFQTLVLVNQQVQENSLLLKHQGMMIACLE